MKFDKPIDLSKDPNVDPWGVLGVDQFTGVGMTRDEYNAAINKKFRSIAKNYHPDRVKNQEENFKKIGAARDNLLNPMFAVVHTSSYNYNRSGPYYHNFGFQEDFKDFDFNAHHKKAYTNPSKNEFSEHLKNIWKNKAFVLISAITIPVFLAYAVKSNTQSLYSFKYIMSNGSLLIYSYYFADFMYSIWNEMRFKHSNDVTNNQLNFGLLFYAIVLGNISYRLIGNCSPESFLMKFTIFSTLNATSVYHSFSESEKVTPFTVASIVIETMLNVGLATDLNKGYYLNNKPIYTFFAVQGLCYALRKYSKYQEDKDVKWHCKTALAVSSLCAAAYVTGTSTIATNVIKDFFNYEFVNNIASGASAAIAA